MFDNITAAMINEKICKYILKFFLLFKRNERGIKKIKAKKSSLSELFKPIRNKIK